MKKIHAYENDKITLTDPYYINATEKVVANVLSLDPEKFLAGFYENAAYACGEEITLKKLRYGGWENTLIGGHTFGHYLTALAQSIVNPVVSDEKKAECKKRLDFVISELEKCQKKTVGTNYEGYLFSATLPDESFKNKIDLQFDNVEKRQGDIFKQAWVPWYTMHKILQGLLDVYTFTGDTRALTLSENLGKWISRRVNAWDEKTRANVFSIEYGGMNDVLYQLYAVSKCDAREDFLKAAHQFDEDALFLKVQKNTPNAMNNTHANTTIPKFIGAMKRYEATGDEDYLNYAKAFWTMVTKKHTYVTGGNSENEHFGMDNVLAAERTNINNETCNTFNMLKLSRGLFEITGEKKYADYYENTYLNAILASQNPETGCTMYFQPMATGYQKVYTRVDKDFWCCTGTGWENFTKLQDSIYYRSEEGGKETVIVTNYVSSVLDAGFAKVKVDCNFLKSETVKIKIEGDNSFCLKLRVPEWTDETLVKTSADCEKTDGFLCFKNKAEIEVTFPMEMKAFGLQDDENTKAFKYGPYVLSARLGTGTQETGSVGMWVTTASKKAVENDDVKITNGQTVEEFMKNLKQNFDRSEENEIPVWTLKGCDRKLEFIPHYLQHKESYGIYWRWN